MIQFSFSKTKTISRNTTTYPITLSDVKTRSQYFATNPTDDTLDSYINSILIPKVIFDWEKSTGYILLDTSIQSFVPSLQIIRGQQINILYKHLNIREFTNIKYYPYTWNFSDAKTTFDSSNYFFIPEISSQPAKLNFKEQYLPIEFYPIENNLECNYLAGFASNNFTSLNSLIKDALASQTAMAVDVLKGYCDDLYSGIISEIYADYSIDKQEILVI
jgi:hypothetical protein